MLRRLIAPAAVTLSLALPASAAAATVDVPDLLGSRVAKARQVSGLRVLLPDRLTTAFDGRLYPGGSWLKGLYTLEVSAAKRCNTATVCFIAGFSGQDGGVPTGDSTVALAKGRTGHYTRSRCGASCAVPQMQWKEGGTRYTIEVKGLASPKRGLKKLANQAIRAGER